MTPPLLLKLLKKATQFRLIPALEAKDQLVASVQTVPGQLLLIACYSATLWLYLPEQWLLITPLLLLFTLAPRLRRTWLLLGTSCYALFGVTDFQWEKLSPQFSAVGDSLLLPQTLWRVTTILLVLAFCALVLKLARHWNLRRPVALLILSYGTALCVFSYLPLPAEIELVVWSFIHILGFYFWFLCYSLHELKAPQPVAFRHQVGHYLPFWFPNDIPIPKGSSYLARIEAKNPHELAISQLKGLKLALWACLLHIFTVLFQGLCYGEGSFFSGTFKVQQLLGKLCLYYQDDYLFSIVPVWNITLYEQAVNLARLGVPLPWQQNWLALIANFILMLLQWAVGGHFIIALVRMCGFNALRNTYSPHRSRSIAEFWNRYVYYYKELLVEFFFYPTFFRYFKKNPLLRTYCATMAAAFFGNTLYHFFQDRLYVLDIGFLQAVINYQTPLFYTFILGNAIFVSQVRLERGRLKTSNRLKTLFAPFGVLGFFCLLGIFSDSSHLPLRDYWAFCYALFNL